MKKKVKVLKEALEMLSAGSTIMWNGWIILALKKEKFNTLKHTNRNTNAIILDLKYWVDNPNIVYFSQRKTKVILIFYLLPYIPYILQTY